jgi:DNA replication protein DnaC
VHRGAPARGFQPCSARETREATTKENAVLLEQTLEKMNAMKLFGMAKALREWNDTPKKQEVSVQDFVGLLTDAEWVYRENRKLQLRLAAARFKMQACVEDIDFGHARGLSKSVVLELASSGWVQQRQNVILTGHTGLGKSYLACALGQKACRDGFTVVYRRATRLFDELALARGDGSYGTLLKRFAKTNVLILDDFGLEALVAQQRKDLLEILDDRYSASSTIITSQLEPKDWHAVIGDPTLADAICDRLVHNAHRIKLGASESIRKTEHLTSKSKSSK